MTLRNLSRYPAIVLAGLLCASPATAQSSAPISAEQASAQAREQGALPIGRDRDARMTVSVGINGEGPFDFMIDTGAERTIVSRQLSEKVGLPQGQNLIVRSVLGARVTPTAMVRELRLSNRRVNLVNSPVLDSLHIGADGILGLDSLAGQRVTFDFRQNHIRIAPSSLRSAEVDDVTDDDSVERVVVPARVRRGNLVLANTRVMNADVPVVIDSGADVSIGNDQLKRLLSYYQPSGIGIGSVAPQFFATLQSVTGQTGEVEVMLIDRLVIDGIEMKKLLVAFVPTALFKQLGYENRPALLLGMDALRRFERVQIDFGARKVRFDVPIEGRTRFDTTELAANL